MKSILSNNKTHWCSKKFVNENNFVKEGIQSNYLEKIHSADVPRNGQKLNNDFRGSNTSQLAILLSLSVSLFSHGEKLSNSTQNKDILKVL